MRIACIHIPQLSLQCATRIDASLRGAPVAIVGAGQGRGPLRAPLVTACSRAAWAEGVRLGMTAPSARARCPALVVVPLEAALERETARALADALLAISGLVELGVRTGPHLAMYAEVPTRTRGHAFGERVLELAGALGLTVRVGIADDRFTAWVAASQHSDGDAAGVIAVPRGGSAAFLAPRPLSLLAISHEVQHMLEALGVTTLGAFAALPAPSVARPLEADYQALARGDSGVHLRSYLPDGPIREEIAVAGGGVLDTATGGLGGPAAIAELAKRLALRLAGRERAAARLEVSAAGAELPLELDRAIASPEELARALAPVLDGARGDAWRLRVVVAGEAIAGAALPLPARAAEPLPIDPLARVLANSPDELRNWALSPPDPRAERRDAHRRTRRGKQRRARPVLQGQPLLFDAGRE
jgi:nucleotidyltransferase/DNA polymerase involved in DNA repair